MPHISVIIPTYNRLHFVEKAIQSVYAQSYQDFELIIVDDGSSDGSGRALRNLLQPGTHYLYQENRGVSAARNTGLDHATGEWICFLDSDDHWLEKKLERQVRFHTERPDLLISQTEEIWIRHGTRVNQMKKHKKPAGEIYAACLPLCCISPSSVMIHTSVFAALGRFDETLPACEDYDLWLRISCTYPVGLLDEALLVKHGGHTDQLSRTIPTLDVYRIKALRAILENPRLSHAQWIATRRELKKKCLIYAGGCAKRGKQEEAKKYQALAESCDASEK
jgi:glycosyltransferase involved in cell wall biosynthesis